jgi:hypothetical protein
MNIGVPWAVGAALLMLLAESMVDSSVEDVGSQLWWPQRYEMWEDMVDFGEMYWGAVSQWWMDSFFGESARS